MTTYLGHYCIYERKYYEAAGAGSFDSGGYGWQEIKMSTSTTTLFFPYKNTKAHIALKNVPQAQQEPLDAE